MSKRDQLQLFAGLCKQVGEVPAVPAEPGAAANVPAEVSVFVCLFVTDDKTHKFYRINWKKHVLV